MAIADSKKVDLLWKKIGFGKAKTDTNAAKKAANEAIVSDLIIKPSVIWDDAGQIPGTQPSSNTSHVTVYTELEMTEDTTATARRTNTKCSTCMCVVLRAAPKRICCILTYKQRNKQTERMRNKY